MFPCSSSGIHKGLSKLGISLILCIVSSYKHEWHWTDLDICPNSYNSMLPISCSLRLDSSLNFVEFSGFPRSSRIDFVRKPFLDFPLLGFYIRSSSFKITPCAIPSILRSTLTSGYSFSTHDSVLRSGFLAMCSSGSSVGLPCSSLCTLCTSFLVLEDALFRCVLLLLLLLRLLSTLKYNPRCGTRRREPFK